jgi:hypothetical protein
MPNGPTDIGDFASQLEDLIDETEASYIEIIGTLEMAKQKLLVDALDDEDDEFEDDDDDDDDWED